MTFQIFLTLPFPLPFAEGKHLFSLNLNHSGTRIHFHFYFHLHFSNFSSLLQCFLFFSFSIFRFSFSTHLKNAERCRGHLCPKLSRSEQRQSRWCWRKHYFLLNFPPLLQYFLFTASRIYSFSFPLFSLNFLLSYILQCSLIFTFSSSADSKDKRFYDIYVFLLLPQLFLVFY